MADVVASCPVNLLRESLLSGSFSQGGGVDHIFFRLGHFNHGIRNRVRIRIYNFAIAVCDARQHALTPCWDIEKSWLDRGEIILVDKKCRRISNIATALIGASTVGHDILGPHVTSQSAKNQKKKFVHG